MTELSTETYISYNKTVIMGQNVLVQKGRGWNVPDQTCQKGETTWSETSRSETSRSKKVWGRNVQVQKVRGRNFLVQNVSGRNIQVQNVRGRNVLVQNVRGLNVQVQNVRWRNVQVQNVRGAKRPGPKRLSAKTLPEPSLHECETSSMIMTLDEASLWLWDSFIIIIIWFMTR